MFQIPAEFMAQFEVRKCSDCGLEHAAVRSCEEAREFHACNNKENDA